MPGWKGRDLAVTWQNGAPFCGGLVPTTEQAKTLSVSLRGEGSCGAAGPEGRGARSQLRACNATRKKQHRKRRNKVPPVTLHQPLTSGLRFASALGEPTKPDIPAARGTPVTPVPAEAAADMSGARGSRCGKSPEVDPAQVVVLIGCPRSKAPPTIGRR